jgi:hypothetical protein
MPATMTTFDAALKEDYQPAIRGQLNQKYKMLTQVEKNTEDVEGRRGILSLEVARTGGIGARREGDSLPTAGATDFAEERIPLRTQTGRVRASQQLISASKSDAGAFARGMKKEMKSLVDNLYRGANRQIYGTSDGVIATCAVSGPSTTFSLATATTYVQIQQLEVGMLIDVATVAQAGAAPPAGGKVHGATISAIVETAGAMTVTTGSSITTAATDFVFQAGAGGSGANQREITGLQTIVAASGTLFNVDPTTDPVWKSTVDSNSGTNRAISESLIEKQIQTVDRRSDSTTDYIVCSDGVYRSTENLFRSLKRFNNTMELKGGAKAQSINAGGSDIAIVWERDCPANQMFGLSLDHLIKFEEEDWQWMDQDGAILSRIPDQLGYEATMFSIWELATDKRSAHWLIKDITES